MAVDVRAQRGDDGGAGRASPAPSPAGRRGGPRGPRRWVRRLLIGAIVVVLLLVAAVGGGLAYLHYRLGQVKKMAVSGTTSAAAGAPLNVLIIGSDTRAGESSSAAQHFGSATVVAGQRSDVIILVHIDPAAHSAAMLSIPRDTFVRIAGTNGSDKINAAFNSGPSQLVQTISDNFGVAINHVIQVNFQGVQDVTNAVGGVCMNFPYPARDGSPTGYGNESGLNIPTAGRHILNGTEALSLVRSRYYQYYKNGQWIPEGTGDLGRVIRQHEYLRALATAAIHDAKRNPLTANALVGDFTKDVTLDSGFTSGDLLRLASEMRSVNPAKVPSWTLPTKAVNNYGSYGDVLMPDPSADAAVFSAWANYGSTPSPASTTTTAPPTTEAPGQVRVEVLNGSGVTGQAAQTASALSSAGFTVTSYNSASSFTYTSSVVSYGPGQQAAARTVAAYVGGSVTLTEDPSLGTTVVLTTGSDFTGISAHPGTPAPPASGGGTSAGSSSGSSSAAVGSGMNVPPWDPTPCAG